MHLSIYLTPRSSKNRLVLLPDGTYKAYVTCPPVDNEANEKLFEVVSDHFKIPRSNIILVRGRKSRRKTLEIPDEILR